MAFCFFYKRILYLWLINRVELKPLYKLHFLVLLWGFTGLFGRLISIGALPLVFVRISIACIAIYIFLKVKRIALKETRKNMLILFGIGGVIGLHWTFFFGAIKASNVSVALSTLATGALFTAFLEPLFFKRKIRLSEIGFSIIVILCLYFIFRASPDYVVGILMGIFCSFLSALFSVLNAKIQPRFNASKMMFYELLGGALLVLPLIILNGDFAQITNMKIEDLGWLLILGVVLTAYPMIESTKLLAHIKPFTILLAINMEPVYGIILAYFIFGESEKMSPDFYIASVIMIIVIICDEMLKKRHKKARESEY